MGALLIYLIFGVMIGVVEVISVLLINDKEKVRTKIAYGILAGIFWPLILIVTFIPEKLLAKLRIKP